MLPGRIASVALFHQGKLEVTNLQTGAACREARVPGTTEVAKKGTLRVDLQALTVGVALLAMHRWLVRFAWPLLRIRAASALCSSRLSWPRVLLSDETDDC